MRFECVTSKGVKSDVDGAPTTRPKPRPPLSRVDSEDGPVPLSDLHRSHPFVRQRFQGGGVCELLKMLTAQILQWRMETS